MIDTNATLLPNYNRVPINNSLSPTMTKTRKPARLAISVYYYPVPDRKWVTVSLILCVFITAVPIIKLLAWGEGDSGGHVLRETMSLGLCGLVCSSRTSERGGEGDCVKEGGGGQGKRERERARKTLARRHTDGPLWAALLKTTVICEA